MRCVTMLSQGLICREWHAGSGEANSPMLTDAGFVACADGRCGRGADCRGFAHHSFPPRRPLDACHPEGHYHGLMHLIIEVHAHDITHSDDRKTMARAQGVLLARGKHSSSLACGR